VRQNETKEGGVAKELATAIIGNCHNFEKQEQNIVRAKEQKGHESLGPRGGPPDYAGPIHPAYSAVKQQRAKNGNDDFYDTIIARRTQVISGTKTRPSATGPELLRAFFHTGVPGCCLFEIRILRVLTSVTL